MKPINTSPLERVERIRMRQKLRQKRYEQLHALQYRVSLDEQKKRQELIDQICADVERKAVKFRKTNTGGRQKLLTAPEKDPQEPEEQKSSKKRSFGHFSANFDYDDVLAEENKKIMAKEADSSVLPVEKLAKEKPEFAKVMPSSGFNFAKKNLALLKPSGEDLPDILDTPSKTKTVSFDLKQAESSTPTDLEKTSAFSIKPSSGVDSKKPASSLLSSIKSSPTSLPGSAKESEKPSFLFSLNKKDTASKPTAGFSIGTSRPQSEKLAPSFGKASESVPEKPKFSFGNTAETATEKPAFSFSKPTSTDEKPTFSFGKKESDKPALSLSSQKSDSTLSKPSISFGKFTTSEEKSEEPASKTPILSFGKTDSGNGGLFTGSGGAKDSSTGEQKAPDPPKTFSFGQNTADKPSLSFGAKPETGGEKPSSGFSFGKKAETASGDKQESRFSFNKKPEENKTSAPVGTSSSDSKPSFTFGAKPDENKSGSSFNEKPADNKSTAFSFGAKQGESKPSGFSFGAKPAEEKLLGFSFGGNSNEKKTSGFSFGQSSTENKASGFGEKPNENKPSGFSFGQSSMDNKSSGFGGVGQNTSTSSAGGFGSKPESSSTSVFGTTKPGELKTGFSFGASGSASSGASKPSFNFNQANTNEPKKPAFSFGNTEKPPTSTFSFSAKPANGDQNSKPLTGFSFGQNNNNTQPGSKPVFGGSKPAFGFGNGSSGAQFGNNDTSKSGTPTPSPAPFTSSNTQNPSSGFTFGAQANTPSPFGAKPATNGFGQINTAAQASSSTFSLKSNGFAFNSKNTVNPSGFGATQPQSLPFGGPLDSAQGGKRGFDPVDASSKRIAGGFPSTNNTPSPFSTNGTAPANKSQGFNFSNANQPQFNFGATSGPPSITFGQSTPTQGGFSTPQSDLLLIAERKILKPRRRTRR